jgi:hypothetical protein
MDITIELNGDEESRLRAVADRRGMSITECARQVLVTHLPDEEPQDRTLELFEQWAAEDATDDPEEIARRNREWEEFRDSMNATRVAAGARPLYP